MTLAEFLLARIAEDESAALAATEGCWRVVNGPEILSTTTERRHYMVIASTDQEEGRPPLDFEDAEHIARHDPARVLAECEAKRRIVQVCAAVLRAFDHEPGAMWDDVNRRERHHARLFLEALALPYADHPDYREEWRP